MFSNEEYCDMHYLYGLCDGNAAAAEREYQIRFPRRRHPKRRMFEALHRRIGERSVVQPQHHVGRSRHNVNREEEILVIVAETPSVSTRRIAYRVNVPQVSVWRILNRQGLHPFHLHPVQELLPRDYQYRCEYCRWLLHKNVDEPDFLNHVLWTDEAGFTRDGVLNLHNLHVWSDMNPYVTRCASFQYRFCVNVWAGIIGNNLIGPYIMEDRITSASYLNFLDTTLPGLLEDVPLNIRRQVWYQLDGAPPHFTRPTCQWLHQQFPARWIGKAGPVSWPARSPDLTPLDFFLWGCMKEMIYSSMIEGKDDLVQRINAAAADIRQRRLCDNLNHEIQVRAELCLRNRGQHFEHLL